MIRLRTASSAAALPRTLALIAATANVTFARGMATAEELPVLFISHGGGPSFYMEGNEMMAEMGPASKAAHFFRTLREHKAVAPWWPRVTSLLVVSAHWEEPTFTVTESARPPLLFDYYGFPPETYKLTWPVPGSPPLAARVRSLLHAAGLPAGGDAKRGLDHGVFVPLKLVVPDADLPVVQLSLHKSLDPALHLRLGAALAPLRREGVLVVASGFATHNLQDFFQGRPGAAPVSWLREFDAWLGDTVLRASPEERVRQLAAPEASAPGGTFRRAHPREEHFTPLQVAVGAAAPEAVARVLGGPGAAGVAADGSSSSTAESGGAAAAQQQQHESAQVFSQFVLGRASMACFLLH